MDNQLFPWCQKIWTNIISSIDKNRFPHAILFFGNQGLGKLELAQQLAKYLLCSHHEKNSYACGSCKDCILFSAKTHGDFYCLSSENNKAIGIEQIRDMKTEASQKPQRGNTKVFIINHADKLSIAASNALLKTLEEPPGGSVFILTSERKNFLSPTILSRCQHYTFLLPSFDETAAWLKLISKQAFSEKEINEAILWSLGAPLLARQLLENNLVIEYTSYAESLLKNLSGEISRLSLYHAWNGKPLINILFVIQMTCYYLLKNNQVPEALKIKNPEAIKKTQLYHWLKKVIDIKKIMSSNIALNEALILDTLLT